MSETTLAPVRHGPFAGSLDPETIALYAAATGDQTASVLDGLAVPTVFPVILAFAPNEASRGDLPESIWQNAVHHIDGDVAYRYSQVSGDWSAHHFDIAAARAAGFDFVFTHGLCTMAIGAHRVLGIVGIDDPGRVRRIAARFAAPTPLDCDLTVNAFGISENSFAFEAEAGGATTITHGRLELRT